MLEEQACGLRSQWVCMRARHGQEHGHPLPPGTQKCTIASIMVESAALAMSMPRRLLLTGMALSRCGTMLSASPDLAKVCVSNVLGTCQGKSD